MTALPPICFVVSCGGSDFSYGRPLLRDHYEAAYMYLLAVLQLYLQSKSCIWLANEHFFFCDAPCADHDEGSAGIPTCGGVMRC